MHVCGPPPVRLSYCGETKHVLMAMEPTDDADGWMMGLVHVSGNVWMTVDVPPPFFCGNNGVEIDDVFLCLPKSGDGCVGCVPKNLAVDGQDTCKRWGV